MKRLLLSLALLLSIGGNANAYLCAPSNYVPSAHPYPEVGWCQWQPAQYDNNHPSVTECPVGPVGPEFGAVWFYDGLTWTGHCAQISVDYGTYPYFLTGSFDFVRLNGWLATANNNWTYVKSFKIGKSGSNWGGGPTVLKMTNGPYVDAPGYATCTYTNTLWNSVLVVGDPPKCFASGNQAFMTTAFTIEGQVP
jgi:hypothetical protein